MGSAEQGDEDAGGTPDLTYWGGRTCRGPCLCSSEHINRSEWDEDVSESTSFIVNIRSIDVWRFRVALFNPWGNDVVYTYDTAMNDCYLLAWLKNNDTLGSTESSSSFSFPTSFLPIDSGTFCSETDSVSTSTLAESQSRLVGTLNQKDNPSSISSSFEPNITSAPEGVEGNIVWVTEMVVVTKFVYE